MTYEIVAHRSLVNATWPWEAVVYPASGLLVGVPCHHAIGTTEAEATQRAEQWIAERAA